MAELLEYNLIQKWEDLIISPQELISNYLFGVRLVDKYGNEMSLEDIKTSILSAQRFIENYLSLRLLPQIIEEDQSFNRTDFFQWGYIPTTYPVVQPYKVDGWFNTYRQLEYPKEWLCARKTNDELMYHRRVYLVPAGPASGVASSAIVYHGITPHLNFLNQQNIPDYFKVTYCTGYSKIPTDIINMIGKLAAIDVLAIMSDILLGFASSQSLSLDGLSQSLSKPASGVFGPRIQQYMKELEIGLPRLSAVYKGITFTAC